MFGSATRTSVRRFTPQDKLLVPILRSHKKKPSTCSTFFNGLPEPSIAIPLNQAQFDTIIQGFQNLSYIGEMRQRWNEIKKLQNATPLALAI